MRLLIANALVRFRAASVPEWIALASLWLVPAAAMAVVER
jgi:hypothetical protein